MSEFIFLSVEIVIAIIMVVTILSVFGCLCLLINEFLYRSGILNNRYSIRDSVQKWKSNRTLK